MVGQVNYISADEIQTKYTHILDNCLEGKIYVVKGFLHHVGIDDRLYQIVLSGIRNALSSADAAALESEGCQFIHKYLAAKEVALLTLAVDKIMTKSIPMLTRQILSMGAAYNETVWVARRPFLRFHTPYSHSYAYTKKKSALKRRYGSVGFGGLGPHRDVWHSEPPRTVNLWSALGPVKKGNGLTLFPEDYTRSLEYIHRRSISRSQSMSKGINFELEPGDAILFSGSQLHASELNITNETRIVFGTRISLSNPKETCSHPARFCKVRIGSPISFLKLNEIFRFAARVRYRLFPAKRFTHYEHIHAGIKISDVEREDFGPFKESEVTSVSLSSLEQNEPRIESKGKILIKVKGPEGTEVWQLDRACPHCGSDLSLGKYVDGRIYCPWQNLPIDIRTGKSPCREIRKISTRQLVV
jgi:nitrite reductase/ring-hydroxylating ferredoxin subunit